ncbi:MAG: NAD-dependent epimerase/dehydratase family protein [Corallococcus sp.]|nr:NAD-dependent epimerase/dehydratase family protein [Corallococcus sp.]MCM1359652.1 NAD-dependent epimerase/dehydratase family protein [Corallococcus sp.]MCM1395361.1 NAD-dependent epimerase/dehydratase family protein [Corallococcus sp.]
MVIAVFGAKGRVGRRVCELAKERGHDVIEIDKENVEGATVEYEPVAWGAAESCDTALTSEIKNAKKKKIEIDVAIDFSAAEATKKVCEFCKTHRCALVTGTTGRNAEQEGYLEELKSYAKVLKKANFSKGLELTEQICKTLAALNWDCDIIETHRRGKADRPSGTAKQLCKTVLMGGTRTVCVHSLRNGSNFGKHEIVFGGKGESITVTHQAENVDIFARGALDAAEKILEKNLQ